MPGGPVAEDELIMVSHIVTPDVIGRDGTTAYLGHLFVEPKRHAPGCADLTEAEARSAARESRLACRALRQVAGAEHMYSGPTHHEAASHRSGISSTACPSTLPPLPRRTRLDLATGDEDVFRAIVTERLAGESAIERFDGQAGDIDQPEPFILRRPPE